MNILRQFILLLSVLFVSIGSIGHAGLQSDENEPDTVPGNRLIADTIFIDSLLMTDSVYDFLADSLLADTFLVDTVVVDSILPDTIAIDDVVADSVRAEKEQVDTIKTDTFIADTIARDIVAVNPVAIDTASVTTAIADSIVADTVAVDSAAVDSMLIERMEAPLKVYEVEYRQTSNFYHDQVNSVEGVVLHHTAMSSAELAVGALTNPKKDVSTHVVIAPDGKQYVLAHPRLVTFHAGRSMLNGKERCNLFTVGIEFQGNTLRRPLTYYQIYSAIQYLRPIIEKYNIPVENIVTHEMVRDNWLDMYPGTGVPKKVDITQKEYKRVMKIFKKELYGIEEPEEEEPKLQDAQQVETEEQQTSKQEETETEGSGE